MKGVKIHMAKYSELFSRFCTAPRATQKLWITSLLRGVIPPILEIWSCCTLSGSYSQAVIYYQMRKFGAMSASKLLQPLRKPTQLLASERFKVQRRKLSGIQTWLTFESGHHGKHWLSFLTNMISHTQDTWWQLLSIPPSHEEMAVTVCHMCVHHKTAVWRNLPWNRKKWNTNKPRSIKDNSAQSIMEEKNLQMTVWR